MERDQIKERSHERERECKRERERVQERGSEKERDGTKRERQREIVQHYTTGNSKVWVIFLCYYAFLWIIMENLNHHNKNPNIFASLYFV